MPVQKFIPSSRLQALVNSTSKSVGASCNTYKVQDSISSIADSHAWSYQVLAYQGAPSIDISSLRPRDSKLGSGGVSSGAVSFSVPFDAIVSTMRREEKKNGAGIVYLSYDHPDLQEFLSTSYKNAYKAVWLPMHGTAEAEAFVKDKALVNKLAKAYNEFKCFLVKKPLPIDSEELLVNLCTEVEIPHRGSCVLGAHNLAAYVDLNDFSDSFPSDFRSSALEMLQYFNVSQFALKSSPLDCTSPLNRQFGLGILGLATALGDFGIRYSELGNTITQAFDAADDDLTDAEIWLLSQPTTPVIVFARALVHGYVLATEAVRTHVRAAFCIQPTVSTAQRTLDTRGFNVSPEIQPVIGLKHDTAVSTIVKSAIKGDKHINYSRNTWTIDEVPYADYAKVSNGFQRLLDSTGLAHRHSHCYYGSVFTGAQLKRYYTDSSYNRIKSLYYRLSNQVNTDSLRKDTLWQQVNEGELADFSVDSLLNGGSCQVFSSSPDCDCTM